MGRIASHHHASKGRKTMAQKTVGVQVGKHTIPISAIEVDRKWNSRNAYGKEVEGDDWLPFAASFDRGQDTDIIVMLNPKETKGKPYFLVSGHRRLEVLSERAQTPGLEPGMVRADVRKMSWSQARETNIRENKAREGVSSADTAWAVKMLVKDFASENREVGQVEMANALGMTQPYVSDLLKVINGFDETRLSKWRKVQSSRIGFKTLHALVKKHPGDEGKEKRYAEFDKLVGEAAAETEGETESNGHTADWVDNAKDKAERIAVQLAKFEFLGLCNVSASAFAADKASCFVPDKHMKENVGNDGAPNAKIRSVLEFGRKAYEAAGEKMRKEALDVARDNAGITSTETPPEESGGKGKKKRGASASAN
jgi:predicted XRE-type DNA-binding protein